MRFLSFVLLLMLAGCSSLTAPRWHSLSDQEAHKELMEKLEPARIIFIGEFHDRRTHHELQLKLIRELMARGKQIVIGMEMFDLESQTALDRWSAGALSLDEFTRVYQQNWTIPWAEYGSILLLARNEKIPLVALNAPLDLVMQVSRHGWKFLRAEDRSRLPIGVTSEITDDYRDFIYGSFAQHQMSPERFSSFCDAQGVRNNTMAILIRQALSRYPDRIFVAITGVGHAMRPALGSSLGAELMARTRIVLPFEEKLLFTLEKNDADFFVIE